MSESATAFMRRAIVFSYYCEMMTLQAVLTHIRARRITPVGFAVAGVFFIPGWV
ncbi:hypothetical protein EDF68_108101 [Ochrobactrum sp. BH3]|nr:hypothetical protein EDF68_108101 [Ochrobactrum sp. BH3]